MAMALFQLPNTHPRTHTAIHAYDYEPISLYQQLAVLPPISCLVRVLQVVQNSGEEPMNLVDVRAPMARKELLLPAISLNQQLPVLPPIG